MLFRQLFDPATSTWTYLLADTDAREAVLIDPVREQAERDATILEELGLRLVSTLETHVHADHVTGAWVLKQKLGSAIAYPATSGVNGADRLLDEGDVVRFGRYALEVVVGRGGTSSVYAALDNQLRRRVAVKVIHPEHARTESQRRRIRR